MSLSKIVQENVSLIKDLERQTVRGLWWVRLDRTEEILISSQISLLEAELERKEKTRRDENFYLRDAVSIVEEDISYLQDQITKCKELIK